MYQGENKLCYARANILSCTLAPPNMNSKKTKQRRTGNWTEYD
jgi:hypothetical protein